MERIRDAMVAEEIAAQAGTDGTPELVLSDQLTPVVFAPQRPPLATSGYFSGTIGLTAGAIAANTSHAGIFGSGLAGAIVRVNWIRVLNNSGGTTTFTLRRVDSPFTGFPSVAAVPGYINAGNPTTGRVFSITKTDTVAAQGVQVAAFLMFDQTSEVFPGPWTLNDGILLLAPTVVNSSVVFSCGYEVWNAIRAQAPGG